MMSVSLLMESCCFKVKPENRPLLKQETVFVCYGWLFIYIQNGTLKKIQWRQKVKGNEHKKPGTSDLDKKQNKERVSVFAETKISTQSNDTTRQMACLHRKGWYCTLSGHSGWWWTPCETDGSCPEHLSDGKELKRI